MTMIVECHVNKKSHMSVNFRRETTKLWENIRGRNSWKKWGKKSYNCDKCKTT